MTIRLKKLEGQARMVGGDGGKRLKEQERGSKWEEPRSRKRQRGQASISTGSCGWSREARFSSSWA